MKYKTVGIPKVLFERFLHIQPMLGYRNFSEFVVNTIRRQLNVDELTADRLIDKKVEERMEETVIR